MGALPSVVTCNPASSNAVTSNTLYSVNGRLFTPQCQQDSTGRVLWAGTANFHDCIVNCSANTQCNAVTWWDDICYMKSGVKQFAASTMVDSFQAIGGNVSPTCPDSDGSTYSSSNGDFDIHCGVDYPGIGDMGSSAQPDFQSCIDTCAATTGCITVVYSGDACYMKNAIGPATSNSGVSTAIMASVTYIAPVTTPDPADSPTCPSADGTQFTTSSATYTITCNGDYYGGDIASLQTASFEGCIAACDDNNKCVDLSYRNGACYLKSKVTSLVSADGVWAAIQTGADDTAGDTTPAPSVNTLVVTCPSTTPTSYTSTAGGKETAFELACGTDYNGGDFFSTETATLQLCVDACASHAECVALAYQGVGCYLKSILNTPNVNPSSGLIGGKLVLPASSSSSSSSVVSSTSSSSIYHLPTPPYGNSSTPVSSTTTSSTSIIAESSTSSSIASSSTSSSSILSPSPVSPSRATANACATPFQCNGADPVPCNAGAPAGCFCYSTASGTGGICANNLSCNTECFADADCDSDSVCVTNACCSNSNGSLCVKVETACANVASPKLMFAKMKRTQVWSDALGVYVESIGGT